MCKICCSFISLGKTIRAEIKLLRANQIAGNTTDFKMNIINILIHAAVNDFNCQSAAEACMLSGEFVSSTDKKASIFLLMLITRDENPFLEMSINL